jgi:hypothetical protein
MDKLNFRTLNANEIDCRIATVKENGITLLLYKDARVDMNILDEVMGPMNWQRKHTRDNANCIVSLWDEEKQQWIEKEDTGTESFTAKEKGLASDSFKRACFNWGIGRELYTAPFVWINSNNCTITKAGNKTTCYDDFYVSQIGYDKERNINSLVICKQKGNKEVYRLSSKNNGSKEEKEEYNTDPPKETPKLSSDQIEEVYKELKRTGISRKSLLGKYNVEAPDVMTLEQFNDAMVILKSKPDKPIDPATIPPENENDTLPWSGEKE